jgi:hypothetical protein
VHRDDHGVQCDRPGRASRSPRSSCAWRTTLSAIDPYTSVRTEYSWETTRYGVRLYLTRSTASSMALDQVTNHAGQTALHVRPGRSADLVHLRRRSVHSHRVEGDVQRPRPEDLCAPVAFGEVAIVRQGGDVTVIGRGRAIADSRAGRSRALGIAQLNATFTKPKASCSLSVLL